MKNRLLPLLGMLYLLFILTGYIFVQEETALPVLGVFSAGVFAYPISFIVLDIIAEIYGYHNAKLIIYFNVISQLIFCLLITFLLHIYSLRTSSTYAPASYYDKILGVIPRITFSSTLSLLISTIINTSLLTKWKFLAKGRYVWLRSLGSSLVGITIFVILAVVFIDIGRYPITTIMQFIKNTWLICIIELILFSYPALIVCRLLTRLETMLDNIQNARTEFNL